MPGRLDPPGWYDEPRRQLWAATVARLQGAGRVFTADPHVIDTYVGAVMSHRQASELLARTNVLVTRGDKAVENPALAVQRRTADQVARASRALGLASPVHAALAGSPMRGDGARWCDEHGRRECKHQRKAGRGPCHGHVLIPGTGSCRMHAGVTAGQAREAGRERLAAMFAGPADVDPGAALLEEVQWAAGYVRDLRRQLGELAAEPGPDGQPGSGLWWGVAEESTRGDGVTERRFKAGPHVKLAAYERAQERLVRTAAAAVQAGAQRDAVDAAKAVGAGVGRLVDALLDALELSEYQRTVLVPQRVPGVLRGWEPDPGVAGSATAGRGGRDG